MQVLTVDYTTKTAPALFCQSLKNTGFAVLSHHPVSSELIDQSYQQWKNFFHSDTKYDYLYQKPSQDGYFPFRSENAKGNHLSDLKEFYHFYPWGRQPPETTAVSLAMYQALWQLGAELLQWIEDFLPLDVSKKLSMPLSKMIEGSENSLLRILHYPPLQEDVEKNAVRAAPHEDINLITLLPAATTPGLQVQDMQGDWHAVTCDPGNIVVNVGDMLQMCTQRYYKSTTHRVVNPSQHTENHSRYSMPLFLHPEQAVLLADDLTATQYLHQRLREIGIY